MTARLTTEFWVAAYRARLQAADIAYYITSKGDATAGAVIVKVVSPEGARAYQRTFDFDGVRAWGVLAEGAEPDVDEVLAQQRRFDPDLWIIEIEDRDGRTLLDEEGLR